jgi:hypothetical protein
MEARFEATAEDKERATRDADELMKIVTQGAHGSEIAARIDYAVSDVAANLERLRSYVTMAKALFMPVYGIQTDRGTIVCDPISGMLSTTAPLDRLGRGIFQDLLRGGRGAMRWLGQMRLLGTEEAVESTRPHLRSYLTTRIAATKDSNGGPRRRTKRGDPPAPPTTYLADFKVYSQKPELHIEVSPAYFATFKYFGAPTSPATGRIEAGNVIFRATGADVVVVNDPTVVVVPTHNPYRSTWF